MTKYKLKKGQPGFQVTDGHMKGHVFEPNLVYVAVPESYVDRFDPVEVAVAGPGDEDEDPKKTRRAKA